ncbi:MAG: hypothetical protein ACM3O4_02870 [Ignavibacteriales bacterium]
MEKKKRIVIILFVLSFLTLGYGVAYSFFNSNTTLSSNDTDIASFIFNAESLDEFQLSLNDLKPGDNVEYPFSVSNNYMGKVSNVSVDYKITLKTYHLLPLIIELYKVDGETEELVLTCDETYERDLNNEIVCETPSQELGHVSGKLDDYKLKIRFQDTYDDAIYADLVDYLNIKLESWQKITVE